MKQKIGLALSGGGYRAIIFHLGVIKKLHHLKLLDKIDVISTVSGGSIIGAYLLLYKDNFKEFILKTKILLRTNINSLLIYSIFTISFPLSCLYIISLVYFYKHYDFSVIIIILLTISIIILLFIFFFSVFPTSKILEMIYDKLFFKGKKLNELPKSPKIIINSTNIDTGTIFSFSQNCIADNSYSYRKDITHKIEFDISSIKLSFVITASSAFSPFFSPLKFCKRNFINKNDFYNIRPLLIDGGVYDNQGMHKITDSKGDNLCDVVICSDCSLPYELSSIEERKRSLINPFTLLRRTIDILMKRIRGFQFSHSIYGKCSNTQQIAYFSIGWSFDNCIDGFVNAVLTKSERMNLLISLHSIPESILDNKDALTSFIKNKIGFDEIITEKYNNINFYKFKNIKTNLKPIKQTLEDELIEYAAILCELQIKLYCPTIL